MDKRIDTIMARVAASPKYRDSADRVREVLRGVEPLRAGVPVKVERAAKDKTAPNGELFHVKIKASTENVARDAGIIPMSAWENGGLANYERNPMILAFHDYKQPIGISVHTEIKGRNLMEYWLFHEETDQSRTMKALYERGFMRAASVGFIVKDYEILDEEEERKIQEKLGTTDPIFWRALSAELLETSAVPVPADPFALAVGHAARNGRAYGIDVTSITERITSKEETKMPEPTTAPTVEERIALLETANGEILARLVEAEKMNEALQERVAAFDATRTAEPTQTENQTVITDPALPADTRSQEDEDASESYIEIEVREGETEDEAKDRFVQEQVDKVLGAPASK